MKQLENVARDIEKFCPEKSSSLSVDDYLRKIKYNLSELPQATEEEKIRLIHKTISTSVRKFIYSTPKRVRQSYRRIRGVLAEEYATFEDETTAMMSAFQVKQQRAERPNEYYRRMKQAFFQGKHVLQGEEGNSFKSLFLHNLHPSLRTLVMAGHTDSHSLRFDIGHRRSVIF
ncbi:hypothetical protein AAFF_G00209730 [Aldrovandia affinis]|uniref:Uncharacterized protein n=1 Tax=Aldrovandia affinis TaxID=143900 RepID=A0AAD7WUP7_9TELE|nr:hypothetical protein AAFF_G00209730 [Aldrovandia affinis]